MDELRVYENADGKRYSTFSSGGKIKRLFVPKSADGLIKAVGILEKENAKYFVVGNGSNTLISDDGVDNAICLKRIKGVEINGDEIKVSCGETLKNLINKATEAGLSGLENLCGIPATLGGAIRMNAGAFGAEIGDYVTEITVLHGGNVQILKKSDLWFSYRDSVVKEKGYIVVGAKLRLMRDEKINIERRTKEVFKKRKLSQPSEPSLGSVFKRNEGISAGYYIDALHLKGFSVGGAKVSEKHAGFIVNTGGATSKDFKILSDAIIDKVQCAFGITLEREIEIIGEI